ncbi:MAG: amino acid ABC transporter permease [Clostridia bacterium]|nr:amino acid ABC transporter permease [Clostridia bacterium]
MEFLTDVGNIFLKYYPQLLQGVGNTLLISLIGTVAGLVIGLLTGIIRTAPTSKNKFISVLHKIVNGIIAVYVEVFRGTPMMVQAMVIYWGYAFATGGSTLPLIPSGILIVSINTGAYMAEIVRGGIISIDKGQFEGAMSIGMTHSQTMFRVVLPQVIRNILPSVSNEFVINIKDTSVLNVIGVTELYYFAGIIKRMNFQIFQTYLVVCVLYFVMTFSITLLLRFLEKKLDGKENYTIFGSQTNPAAEIRFDKGDK